MTTIVLADVRGVMVLMLRNALGARERYVISVLMEQLSGSAHVGDYLDKEWSSLTDCERAEIAREVTLAAKLHRSLFRGLDKSKVH